MSRLLITGGAGFIGSNLADRLASDGHQVVIYDALMRAGVERNLAWLRQRHGDAIIPVIADIRDTAALADAARGSTAVFHLAAQVAVTTSMVEPIDDFEINVQATVALLDLLRRRDEGTALIFASTNKVYGDLADIALNQVGDRWYPIDPGYAAGVDETRRLDFHTPYGCSKGAADQYVLDYARTYGIPTCVLRMSCVYGQRQMGTEDQGWVAHFLIRALQRRRISIYGDGCQVRDILDVGDAVQAYVAAWHRIGAVSGRAFNLGGGAANAVSLRQLIDHIGTLIGRDVDVAYADWRPGDQRYFVADASAALAALGLGQPRGWHAGVGALADWLRAEHSTDARRETAAA